MSDTARLLSDSVGTFLSRAEGSNPERFRAAVAESGFALALAAEEHGGLGGSWLDAATVVRLWGYHAAPPPIVEMLLAGKLASDLGEPGLATMLTVASGRAASGALVAASVEGAELCVAPSGSDGATHLVRIGGAARWTTIAGEPMLALSTVAESEWAPDGLPPCSEIIRQGGLLTAARMLGAMERIVEMMVEHARTRSQFGRPLAKFQLVQTLVADAAAEIDATRAVIEEALSLLDAGAPDRILWLAAKCQAARGATLVAANAHQVLGAMGFTEEHALRRFTRSLWSWRDSWLSQSEAEERLGALACEAGRDGLWPLLADPRS